ncbi:MAG: T9SS type A sorting domain-containing protein [Aquirufa sp.]
MKIIKHVFTFLSLFLLLCLEGFSQSVQSSTISSGGSTVKVNGKYYSHVVGQQSVAGTVTKNGLTVRQGFKQPNLLMKSIKKSGKEINTAEVNPIAYTVFPNPFKDKLTIKMSLKTSLTSYLVIYDMQGNVKLEQTFPADIDEIVLDKFENFRGGKYIMHILHKGNPFVFTLIKDVE